MRMFGTKSASILALCISNIVIVGALHAQTNEALIREENIQAPYLESSAQTLSDLLFLRALVAQRRGSYDEAVALLNDALVKNPDNLSARRELARTLFLQKKYRLAERSFQELIEIDATPEMQNLYQRFINQIRSQQPFSISGSFAILPSSNVNRGTENLIFDSDLGDFVIDPESRAQSGIGLQAGVFGSYRTIPNSKTRNIVSFSLTGKIYEASAYNTAQATLRFTQENLLNDTTKISFSVYSRYIWRDDDADNSAIGVNLLLLHSLSPKNRLSFGVSYEQREFIYQPYNTGPLANVSVSYARQESPSLSYSIGAKVSQLNTNAEHSAYTGFEINAGVNKEWSGGYITGISLSAGFRGYNAVFPLSGEVRGDIYYRLSASVQNNSWSFWGLVPKASCSYTNNQSNIAFYQYNVSECNFSFNRRF